MNLTFFFENAFVFLLVAAVKKSHYSLVPITAEQLSSCLEIFF